MIDTILSIEDAIAKGFNPLNFRIYFNGEKRKDVTAFSISEGWIEKFATDDTKYQKYIVKDGEVVREKLYGKVEVEYNV